MPTFFATQNAGNPGRITLPGLRPNVQRQAPLQVTTGDWVVAHSASVPLALPCGARGQYNHGTARRLPPVSILIADIEQSIAGQYRRNERALPGVRIECRSLVSRNPDGFPVHDWRHWASNPTFITPIFGISQPRFESRLASLHEPLVIRVSLEGYNHLNIVMPLRHHNCKTVLDLVIQVGSICERFVRERYNNYQGPRGERVGPGYVPLEWVRLVALIPVMDNHWLGVLSTSAP
ncbi:hypothetical protein C0995_004439 [Termitomyces sp. Mi166|nr:hypothetical protein C0995_004439 [Termitomyces sp. Mi166\